MVSFNSWLDSLVAVGYNEPKARSRIAHDVVLMAMEKSGLARNVTIKGGVVMSDITDDVRRATMDMDVDLIRYSLDDDKIDEFIGRLNCIEGVMIERTGEIVELQHRDYHGKRILLKVTDLSGVTVRTKIDLGVHTQPNIRQQTRAFKISLDAKRAKLPANTGEQVFAEKLKSLLIFGARSGRPNDVYDMCYLCEVVNKKRFMSFLHVFIIDNPEMKERSIADILKRLTRTFKSRTYMQRLRQTDANWLDVPPQKATAKIVDFMRLCGEHR